MGMIAELGLSLPPPLAFRTRLSSSPHKPSIPHSSRSPLSHPLISLKPSLHFVGHRLRRKLCVIVPKATDQQQDQVKGDEVVDSKILPYCSIDRKAAKKTVGELEQEFLQALQSFYYEGKAIMSNEEFDNLKEELMWEGSSVVMLSPDEQKFLEASMAYVSGKPILTDSEYDDLKLRLRGEGSSIVQGGPRCSLRSRKVYSDLSVDYFKMLLLNVPAAVIALTLFFFLDDITGFELTYLLELPEPFSFIFTWFAALPLIFVLAKALTDVIVKDFLILKGPCPNCGTENVSFFGTILSVPSGGSTNTVKCTDCGTALQYDSRTRLITLQGSEA
ncbi:PGR5-like protein 1B, chloroplastic [Tasmannia lanceolata]|uniref:PGR5-like protein 1B, chloroplastic n=1 Tax=Tasmannia lanceolata TaxID=3420 RepID=UPI0040636A8A